MKEKIQLVKPAEIEAKSMQMIEQELGAHSWAEDEFLVVKRCIHTSADFDYAENLHFSPQAVKIGLETLRAGAVIVTDTNMAAAGINKTVLARYGGSVVCFMADPDVAKEARERGITRATVCMERGANLKKPVIFAIGNAPTALIRLRELIDEGRVDPQLVIAAPVGFVNVIESKELILALDTAHIVARGRKGGSNIAAAICNALLYQLS